MPQELWPSPGYLEYVASVSSSLKHGYFSAINAFNRTTSDDFLDVVFGVNQAPQGSWDPEWASKGLIPNIKDVCHLLNRSYSRKYCDM